MQRRRLLSAAGCLGTAGVAGCLGVLDSGSDGDDDQDDENGDTNGEDDGTEAETTETERESGVDELSYGFEDPDLPAWTVEDDGWGRTTDFAANGEASATIDTSRTVSVLATATPATMAGGARIERFSYYWREASRSFGGGVTLRNSAGQLELFVGSNNPEWVVLTDADEPTYGEIAGAEGYDRWIRTEIEFDWSDSRTTVTFTDTATDTSASDSFDLGRGTDVETIALQGFTGAEADRGNGLQTDSCVMYWDELSVTL